jgi:hypothetical protein
MKYSAVVMIAWSIVLILAATPSMSPVLALEPEREALAPIGGMAVQAAPERISFAVEFAEPSNVTVFDLSGNEIGQGNHSGGIKCNNNCAKSTYLEIHNVRYVYRASSLQFVDADAGRAIVEGTGTVDGGGMKERFKFTAFFQDNGDGTITTTYEASRPDASFIIPETPGALTF